MGAGPGDPDLLTRRAAALLGTASVVLLDPAGADDDSSEGAADPDLVALAAAFAPGAVGQVAPPVDRWPVPASAVGGSGIAVRLYRGDGLAASSADRAELDRLGIDYDIVAGVAVDATERADNALGGARSARRPLRGRTVVVTRPEHQQAALADPLRRLGATVVHLPTIRIVGPDDGGAALRAALAEVERYRWVVVTSANGARALLDGIGDARRLAGVGLAAIGPATAAVLAAAHLPADLVPEAFVAESLLDAFPPPDASSSPRVLLVRAAVARDTLPVGLRRAGWSVDVVAAYCTVWVDGDGDGDGAGTADPGAGQASAVAAYRRATSADVITFTSPSTVQGLLRWTGGTWPPPPQPAIATGSSTDVVGSADPGASDRLDPLVGVAGHPGARASADPAGTVPRRGPAVAVIGPVTAAAARQAGVPVDIEASRYDVAGLIDAIVEWNASSTRGTS